MDEGDGLHAGRVPHPVLAMSEAEQEQAMQLAQMAQQRAMHSQPDQDLGQVHEHQHSPGLVDAAEISNLKYCRQGFRSQACHGWAWTTLACPCNGS